jgi:hypothetical protein
MGRRDGQWRINFGLSISAPSYRPRRIKDARDSAFTTAAPVHVPIALESGEHAGCGRGSSNLPFQESRDQWIRPILGFRILHLLQAKAVPVLANRALGSPQLEVVTIRISLLPTLGSMRYQSLGIAQSSQRYSVGAQRKQDRIGYAALDGMQSGVTGGGIAEHQRARQVSIKPWLLWTGSNVRPRKTGAQPPVARKPPEARSLEKEAPIELALRIHRQPRRFWEWRQIIRTERCIREYARATEVIQLERGL